MKKRVLAIMLACLMLVSLLPAGALAAESEIKCPGLGEDHYLSNATPVKGSEEVVEGLCGGYDYVVYTCAGCGDKFADNFEKVDGEHDYVVIDEPTCEEEGKKECSICGASEAIEATGHDWEVAGEIVDCTAPMKCANCGEEKEGDAHAWAGTPEIVVKPDESTWTDGLATYSCTVDGCDATKEVVIKCSHVCKDNLKWVRKKAPTCEEDGYRGHYVCTICGNYFNTNKNPIASVIRPATGHVAPEQEIIADLSKEVADESIWIELDSKAMVLIAVAPDYVHAYADYGAPNEIVFFAEEQQAIAAGETVTLTLEAGRYELWCQGFGKVICKVIGYSVEEPTCTEPGLKTYFCTVCGELVKEVLEPEHEIVIEGEDEADCTHNGYVYKLCRRCDMEPIMEITPMLGHSTYEEVLASEDGVIETLDPTCNNDGYIRWYCLRCGELAGETVLEAVGCTEVTITKPATCVKYAYSYTICTNDCHEGYPVYNVYYSYENEADAENMPAYSRNGSFDVTVDGEPVFVTSIYTHEMFGEMAYVIVDVEAGFNGDITAHNRDDMREGIVNEPTCTEMGLSVYICSDCQKHVVEKLPTIEHDYEAFVIEPMCGNFGYTKYICTMCEDEYVDEESIVAPLPLDYEFESLEAADAVHGELFFIESFRDATCDSDLVGLLKYGCADCGKNVLVIDSTGGEHVPGDLPAYEDNVFVEIGGFNGVIYAGENNYGGAYYATEIPFSFATVAYADDIFVFTAPKAGKLIFEFGENVPSKNVVEYDAENDIYFLNVEADREYEVNLWGEDYSVKVYFEGEKPESHEVQIFAGKEATCTEPGYSAQYVCTRCGAFVESVSTEPAHDWEITVEAVAPTCTEAGCTEGKECKICDAVVESEELAALGHTYGDFEIVDERAFTELEDNAGSLFGYQHIEYTCETCGDVIEQIINYVDGCEHVWSEEFDEEASKEPKCCEEGYLAYRCLFCDAYHYEKLDMIHHANKDGVVLSNCAVDQTGVEDRICDCCGEEIPVPEHAWDEGKKYDATCTTYGYILYCCTNEGCEATYVVEIDTPYTDHDFAFDAFVYEDYTTKEVIIGVAYKCKNCDETKIENFDGVAFISEIANKIEAAGTTITDGNTIKVTISLAGLEDALWGFELDVKYSNNLKFLSGNFVDGANFAGHVYNKDGVISIAGNHIDSSKDYALDGREAVVELYFEVNQEKAGEVAIDVEIVDIANYAGETVEGIANDATAKTVELMELDGKEGITVFDVLEAFKLMNAEDYNVAADLNKNGEIDALDIAYMYQYMIEQLTYKQIRALK